MSILQGVGKRIREVRADATQAHFADRIGVDRKTIVRWEDGSLIPNAPSLLYISQSYGLDINWLLTGKGAPPEKTVSDAERRILAALRTHGPSMTEQVLSLLGVDRYVVERQDHEGEWNDFGHSASLEEAQALAGEGFRRVVDLYSGRVVFTNADSQL